MVIAAKPPRQRLPVPEFVTPPPGAHGVGGPAAPDLAGHPQTAPALATQPGPSWVQFVALQVALLLGVSALFGILALGFVASARDTSGGAIQAVAPPVVAPVAATPVAATATPAPAPVDAARLPAPTVAPAVGNRAAQTVKVALEAQEVTGLLAEGIGYRYWTFNGTVPGPMIRVRQGDMVELTLRNAPGNTTAHSIDLNAVTGPGGGGEVTMVAPGESKTFSFQALHSGVFTYQSASLPRAQQIASGMYGLIVVEPPQGLPQVDREFYVMQGELYLAGQRDERGLRTFSDEKALVGQPDYVLFNGAVEALSGANALKARTGETVRIFFGVGGPNLGGNLHLAGEVFDRVALTGTPLDDRARWMTNVSGVGVPVGGAAIIEVRLDVPGRYTILDGGVSNALKGATGILIVEGPENPGIFTPQH